MNTDFVHSSLATDPEFGELVALFVDEMPTRINQLETQARNRDWTQLTRTAHQLKGAAGSYGLHDITPFAARLERAAGEAQQDARILQGSIPSRTY